jgi:phenylpropionate dioxygenase-like ring-hydroxylating dioxygenase large terminal subunit
MIDDQLLLNDWHVVARSDDIPEAGVAGARLLGEDLVIWRRDGQVMAWRDLCKHRGTRLSLGEVGELGLICPYHGWTYDESGTCVHIPSRPSQKPSARACADVYQATERHGLIWVSLGEPEVDVPAYAEWDDPSYRHVLGGPYPIRAAGPRAIENFLDVTHFPFVHEGILGSRDHTEVGDYNVEVGSDGITASEIHTWTPDPDGSGQAKTAKWLYRVLRPLTAYIQLGDPDGGPDHYSMFFAVTPVDERECIGWMWNSMNYNHELSDEDFLAYIDEIVLQDIPIVESQRPELLPLDLQTELHVKPDATAIAYRRWLKELGMTVGVA